MILTSGCPGTADRKHRFDWAASDMAQLTSYGAPEDRGTVVRLSRCSACGLSLLGVATVDAPDDDPGVLLVVLGLELT
ncbi:hypothetical protein [Pseudonocardia alni]|uniref:hypothetical protein n=1 Tax=Pseudonocardia alni TaxID=33907 RepID=UPI0033FD12F9